MLSPRERPVVEKSLAKQPADRWLTCTAFADALQSCSEESTTVPPKAPGRPYLWPWLLICVALVVTVVTLCLGALGLVWYICSPTVRVGIPPELPKTAIKGHPFDVPPALPEMPIKGRPLRQGEIANSIGMYLIEIPAGQFWMGSQPGRVDNQPDELWHSVDISKPFYMGVHEVTQKEFQLVMSENPSFFSSTGDGRMKVAGLDTDSFPVEQVSRTKAGEFCRVLSMRAGEQEAGRSYRLPTEAEWEYACGGKDPGNGRPPFHFGLALSRQTANYNNHLGRTAQVGSYPPNAFGLHDMHGNVWEWCEDWYGKYDLAQKRDPPGALNGENRVFRGGSWKHADNHCRTAFRNSAPRDFPGDYLGGFRVVCVIAKKG